MSICQEDICFTSAIDLLRLYDSGELRPTEVVQIVLDRVERLDPLVHAFITPTPDVALEAVRAAEVRRSSGFVPLPLDGVPVTVKDLTDTAGIRTTYGDPENLHHIPTFDPPMWARIKAAGPSLIGKTSTPPYGWLGVTENEIVGTTNNPWNRECVVGGSSGGAAAALASGLAPVATGSDGGGSIRIPAACCGVVGLKPSHGRVPRGPEENAFCTVGAVGPMARTVADTALMLSIMAGPVEDEPYMLPEKGVDYVASLRAENVRRCKIAYSPDLGRGPVDSEVAKVVAAAVSRFDADLQCTVDSVLVKIPDPVDYFRSYWTPALRRVVVDMPNFAATFARHYPFHQRLVEGCKIDLDKFWTIMTEERANTFSAIASIFATYDYLMLPTMPTAAFPHAGPLGGPAVIDGQSVEWPGIEFHRLTEPFSHTGHPAISVPCGFTSAGLPVGLQIVGRQRDDAGVLRMAAAWEAIAPWADRRPSL
ncbi:amidase family protein [Sphingobium sp. HBC34]|uniref:Amidase family protein n=1 Tax=Sphingobium cyanobacteriorum TaxID=3063954 RepID=A0ABT8ZS76_9SPHN|nr:amidase family protein [Sphingobium sp. HBC34]MDO7837387.1 amidase family protein [Sphingobium sp. HBC34]